MITVYLAKHFMYELPKWCPSDSLEKLIEVVAGSQVDLNPYQVDAVLFARARRAVEESRAVASLRDILIPKLISGELRIESCNLARHGTIGL